ncbi:MAG: lamin tail domain-containing protein [Bacteroidota bacterium]
MAGTFSAAPAQITQFPYHEHVDTVVVPYLPSGWSTSTHKNLSGDFVSSSSAPRPGSLPNCISASDSRVSQALISPPFSFVGRVADSLEFYERRTATFTAGLLVEATIGNDTSFSIVLCDTLKLSPSNNGTYQRRSIALPETVNGRSNVRFRWRTVGLPGSGGTAVLRIDDISLTVKKVVDLSMQTFSLLPASPRQGDAVTGTFTIVNRAFPGNFSGTMSVFDTLILIAAVDFERSVPANDSFSISWSYPNITAGRHPMKALLTVTEDEDTSNNSIAFVIAAGYQQRTMLINEIMYAPAAGSPEWIELVNNSSDTIRSTGWKVSDAGSTKGALSSAAPFIAPYSYVVVTTDTNAFKSVYEITAHLFQAPFSALNNSGDAVVLYDQTNAVIDTLSYVSSWGGGNGRSLERIDTAAESVVQSNWKSSTHPTGATPGIINSVTQKQFDGAIAHITTIPLHPVAEAPITVLTTIKNIGRQQLSVVEFLLYADENNDSIFTSTEVRDQQSLPALAVGESFVVRTVLAPLSQGTFQLAAKIILFQDDDSSNNNSMFDLSVGLPPSSIIINEIMYAPAGDLPEWIEGYNTSGSPVTLRNWKISDNGTAKGIVQHAAPIVPARSYFLITTDTVQLKNSFVIDAPIFQAAIPALNNSSVDAVVLFDERGATMDSVLYHPAWGGANSNSLQRYDPFASSVDSSNWLSGVPSPGTENESTRKNVDLVLHRIAAEKLPDGFKIIIVALNAGRSITDSAIVNLFSDTIPGTGEKIFSSTIKQLAPLDSAVLMFEWRAQISGRKQLFAQIDCPHDERWNNNTGFVSVTNSFPVHTLIINEIMYEPFAGNAEFVELLNRTADSVNISEWKLMDQPGTSGNRAVILLSQSDLVLAPGQYVLIASDSAIFSQFPALAAKNIVLSPALSLSNNGEDLVLVDISGTCIDSVRYSPLWHLKNISAPGRSLERIDPSGNTTDSRNWNSSVSKNGSSPLHSNSIFIGSKPPAATVGLSPNPFSPDQDGFEDFLSINYSLPAKSATIRVRIFDVTGRLIRRLVQQEPSSSTGSVIWNGCDDDGNRVRIGMYIILFEALDNFGGTVLTAKDVAVVARKL